jgi:hypothetical protein
MDLMQYSVRGELPELDEFSGEFLGETLEGIRGNLR